MESLKLGDIVRLKWPCASLNMIIAADGYDGDNGFSASFYSCIWHTNTGEGQELIYPKEALELVK